MLREATRRAPGLAEGDLHYSKKAEEHLTAATRRAARPPARAPPNGLPTHAPVDSAGEKPLAATRAPHSCTSNYIEDDDDYCLTCYVNSGTMCHGYCGP